MKKTLLLIVLTLTFNFTFSQSEWLDLDKNNYTINYPSLWDLDTSGQMNSEFILFSEATESDVFRENINLLIQNVQGQNMTMKDFVELSESQIKTLVPDGKLINSENKNSYHEMTWSGFISNNNLKFKQYFFLKDEKIYVLTYTALQSTYDEYLKTGDKILNSFKLK